MRNLTRAGVAEQVAMAVTGHRTHSTFTRYNIVNKQDVERATARLAEYVAGQSATPTVVPLARPAEAAGRGTGTPARSAVATRRVTL